MNNASFETADRGTHLKIVVLALIASIAVMVVGIAASTSSFVANADIEARGPTIKATKQIQYTTNDTIVIR